MAEEKKGNPATNNDSRLSLLNFTNRHSLLTFKVVENCPKGLKLSEIQDKAGFPRGNPDNMAHRREISRCAEVLVFFKYFRKQGDRFYPTGKKPIIGDEPREFGKSDGLPRVRIQTLASMPFYARGD